MVTTTNLILLDKTSKKTKLFLKMNIIESVNIQFSFVKLCEHIGEAHLFEFMMLRSMNNDNFLYYHSVENIELFEKEYSIKPSTQHKYLKLLCVKGLVNKIRNGVYKINDKYVEWIKNGTAK